MLRRFATLQISLAAKCQILFGAAVVLIIAAALAVPWLRMEALTEELNLRAADALADNLILEHRLGQQPRPSIDPTTRPRADEDRGPSLPQLIPIGSTNFANGIPLNRFEKHALAHLRDHPDDSQQHQTYYRRANGTMGFRCVQPVYLTPQECGSCHGRPGSTDSPYPLPLPVEHSGLVAMISTDFPSRVQENQLLLNRVFILTAGFLAGTFAIVAFYLITTRLILQPVRVLQETAEKVSQGDLNIRSDISTGDEFQQLSETFNVMLANLKQTTDQLRAINKSLDLKLGQLAESNLALYESNRLKSEFLANVSHELRTPLNSILGFAELLKDAVVPQPESKPARYIHNILQSGRQLLDLINDLLDLAKIEAGRMEIRSEPLSLTDLFEGLLNILKPLAEQRNLSIVGAVAPGVPILHTDPGKLQQVLYNFLANAIKFSPANGRIDLAAGREGEDHVRISVTDRGPGIASDQQHIIFEKFRQIDASVTRTHSGTGLGLAISKELTTMMGGSIGVRSTPGEGATFWIVVPLKIQPAALDMRAKLAMT